MGRSRMTWTLGRSAGTFSCGVLFQFKNLAWGAKGAKPIATFAGFAPDSIQLATALAAGASWFLTNDAELSTVSGVSRLGVHIKGSEGGGHLRQIGNACGWAW